MYSPLNRLLFVKHFETRLLAHVLRRHLSEWQLFGAVCVQRLPQISPEMNWLEKKMSDILANYEVNHSLYSDHEMRHFEDMYGK